MDDEQLEHQHHVKRSGYYDLSLVLDNFDSPVNVGSIFRVADALGVYNIYLTGSSPVPPNRKISKTSRSTDKYVSYEYHPGAEDLLRQLKQKGHLILALELTQKSQDIQQIDLQEDQATTLILGSENHGVDATLLSLAHLSVHIPMLGSNSSMNVATACGIAVFELTKRLNFCEK